MNNHTNVRVTQAQFASVLISGRQLVDMRAPIEFSRGSFPAAINLPLMNDDERARVGTCYAEHGEDAAIALGHELVSGKSKEVRIALWVAATIRDPDSVLYCLRGGLRSQTAQSWLAEAGIEVPIIDGGYKALRRFMIDTFDTQLKNTQTLVLGGKTGSAKTSLLVTSDDGSRLPCIDLEGLARHRGSAFGRRIKPQPTQIDFENQISLALLRLHHNEQKTIALEDESRLIGRCALPLNLQAKMRESPLVVVEATLQERVHHSWENYILSNYEDHLVEAGSKELAFIAFSESLRVSLSNIRKRLGNPRFEQLSKVLEQALAAHNSGDPETHKEWIEILLRDYYDPMYDYQLKSKQREIIYRGDFKDVREFLLDRTLKHA
jgi:tRNA 2-selenouridine synthase